MILRVAAIMLFAAATGTGTELTEACRTEIGVFCNRVPRAGKQACLLRNKDGLMTKCRRALGMRARYLGEADPAADTGDPVPTSAELSQEFGSRDPGLSVDVSALYYPVKTRPGETITQAFLRDGIYHEREHAMAWGQMEARDMSYEYRTEQTGGVCSAKGVKGQLSVRLRLPGWVHGPISTESQTQWLQFTRCVRAHEKEHVRIALRSMEGWLRTLRSIPARASCVQFDAAVLAGKADFGRQYSDEQKRWDETSRCGRP